MRAWPVLLHPVYHSSGWNHKWTNDVWPNCGSGTGYDLISALYRDHVGYRLHLSSADIPYAAVMGLAFNVSATLANTHIAPFYRSFYDLQIKFVRQGGGASDLVITLTGHKLREVVKNEPKEFTGSGTLTVAGMYDVYIGIIQQVAFGTGVPVQLAHDPTINSQDGNNQWWTRLGTATAA